MSIFGKIAEVVLERIGHPCPTGDNPALPNTLVNLRSEKLVGQVIVVGEVRKDAMTTLVPRKATKEVACPPA